MPHAKRITVLSIVINATLFLLKLAAGLAGRSLAVMADATNSLLDTLSGLGVYWSVEESHKKADKGHPFGHARAEPVVAFVIAILMGITAFEFIRAAIFNLIRGSGEHIFNFGIATMLLICIAAKVLLAHESHVVGERNRSPALLATAADSRNDVVITITAFGGLIFAALGFPWMDDLAALVIGIFLLYQAYTVGKRNVDYLMGVAPPKELQMKIRALVTSVRGVRGISLIRAHYVGSFVHVEVHILVNPRITTQASHKIAMDVQHDIEHLREVNKAFIHVEPA